MVLHTLTSADGLLDLVRGIWMIYEFSQIIRYGVKSIMAGRRDGRVLTISVSEGPSSRSRRVGRCEDSTKGYSIHHQDL